MPLQWYFARAGLSRVRELLQRLSLTKVLGMDAEGSEQPKAKRPCLEDEKQSDQEVNGGATVKKEVR